MGAAVAPACEPLFVTPPLLDTHVAVWLVIALPLFAPIVNVTVNEPVPVVVVPDLATTFVGGAGEPTITGSDAAEGRPVPTELVAVTEQVYVLPSVRAGTDTGLIARLPVRVVPPFDDVHVAV